MEGNGMDLSNYCRICFNASDSHFKKMLDLKAFLPIIRCIAQTKLLNGENAPSKICEACANGLILANIFRMKVIESNVKCRELLNTIKATEIITSSQESIERIQDIGKVKSKRQQECLLENPASVLKVEVEEFNDETGFQDNESLGNDENDVKDDVKNILETEICGICGNSLEEKTPVTNYSAILNKVLAISDEQGAICTSCTEITKSAGLLFEIREKVKLVKREIETERGDLGNDCQFCLINDVFSTRTPKYLVHKYNSMPVCRENDSDRITSEAKSCKECMKLLKQVHLLLCLYMKRQKMLEMKQNPDKSIKTDSHKRKSHKTHKTKKKRLKEMEGLSNVIKTESTDGSDEEAIPLSKFVKRHKKRLKLRHNPRYIKPSSRTSIPDDYQCHMSDFVEEESDSGVTTPKMGEPLNRPFKHRYIRCLECDSKYITDYELKVHYDVVHRTKGDVCEHCNKKFINFVGVKAHKHKVHFADCSSVSLFRELCEICGVLTKTLEQHQSVHSDARPFVCHKCGHSSKTIDLLAAHVRAMHTGEKRYGCKYCEKRFSYSADRARHEISSHTKQYKYVCRTCNKGFLKKNFLTSHQKTHDSTFLDEI